MSVSKLHRITTEQTQNAKYSLAKTMQRNPGSAAPAPDVEDELMIGSFLPSRQELTMRGAPACLLAWPARQLEFNSHGSIKRTTEGV